MSAHDSVIERAKQTTVRSFMYPVEMSIGTQKKNMASRTIILEQNNIMNVYALCQFMVTDNYEKLKFPLGVTREMQN
jgi:hypothetical protein